jgi:hypothetical protein
VGRCGCTSHTQTAQRASYPGSAHIVALRAWIDASEAAFRQTRAEGDIAAGVDARALAEVTVAAFTGMQKITELMSDGADLDDRVDTYVSLLMQLLGVARTAGASGGSGAAGKEPR